MVEAAVFKTAGVFTHWVRFPILPRYPTLARGTPGRNSVIRNSARIGLVKTLSKPYPTTPAMAAGLTDHVWTIEELLGLLERSN